MWWLVWRDVQNMKSHFFLPGMGSEKRETCKKYFPLTGIPSYSKSYSSIFLCSDGLEHTLQIWCIFWHFGYFYINFCAVFKLFRKILLFLHTITPPCRTSNSVPSIALQFLDIILEFHTELKLPSPIFFRLVKHWSM